MWCCGRCVEYRETSLFDLKREMLSGSDFAGVSGVGTGLFSLKYIELSFYDGS